MYGPPEKELIPDEASAVMINRDRENGRERKEGEFVRRRTEIWVSDHFGIVVGIKVSQ